ncbi:type III secretion system export apparatus subunit SctS [Duganella violaceipulchra]|uniref:Type III secretion protein S n=1 Tax=Duganella violaceipulchra TaxID=2849652 RepID=A0AA41L2I4_9BURK|nr:type III secretion system export apparatus subunit SctS [Duganella violaceicalia]MBV6322453.1 type III secretion system export apparatus subunit SctS [Duganella violaceicalia]MCP2010658.1 type III secretion protein S [Duganella violaceicalia]
MIETIAFFQKGMLMVIWLSAPPLAVAVVAGVLVSLLQTVLSMQDQALPFSCKLLAVGLTLALAGRWMGLELLSLADQAMQAVATLGYHAAQPP